MNSNYETMLSFCIKPFLRDRFLQIISIKS